MTKVIQIFFFSICLTSLFGQTDSSGIAHYFEEAENRVVSQKNIVKLNYLRAALNGNAVISYERYLTPVMSLETHFGMTYWDLVRNVQYGIFAKDLNTDKSFKIGYSLGVGIRLYPKKDEMDGFYINPMYRYLRYNFGEKSDSSLEFDRFHTQDVLVNAGYQFVLNRWVLDYYLGLGLRFVTRQNQQLENNSLVTYGTNAIIPMFPFGFRLGYIF